MLFSTQHIRQDDNPKSESLLFGTLNKSARPNWLGFWVADHAKGSKGQSMQWVKDHRALHLSSRKLITTEIGKNWIVNRTGYEKMHTNGVSISVFSTEKPTKSVEKNRTAKFDCPIKGFF